MARKKLATVEPVLMPSKEKLASGECHSRTLVQGDVADALCILNVWNQSIESVVCLEPSEFYSLHAEEFQEAMQMHKNVFDKIREQFVLVRPRATHPYNLIK